MSHGTLKFDQASIGQGRFNSLDLRLFLKLEPTTENPIPGADQPSHDVYISRTQGGEYVLAGAAWLKSVQQERNRGEKFYSITIDDPSLSHGVNFTAFQSRDSAGKAIAGEFDVVWRRPRQQVAA
jgi:uncharacterized protein (DUF736 family)